MSRIVGLGAGGHAKVVLDILGAGDDHEVVGLLDPNPAKHGTEMHGVPVLGDDDELGSLVAEGVDAAFVGVGATDDTRPRRRLFELARSEGLAVPVAVHPSAVLAPSVDPEPGATIMPNATVNADAEVGENVVVNTAAVVEHDCRLRSHSHVATGASLAGGVTVGEGAHVGIGATVREGVSIGVEATVGAGAVVLDDVPEGALAVGVPAEVRRRSDSR